MQQTVKVIKCNEDGTAQVACLRQSACSGDCHKCSGCGAAKETMIAVAENPIGAKVGEFVKVSTDTKQILGMAMLVYVLPLVLFFAGYALGDLWNLGALCGSLGFVLAIAACVLYDRKIAQKEEVHTITGYAGDSLLRSMNKGEY